MTEAKLVQRAYTTILEHFVQTGRAPHYTELAQIMGLRPDEARELQREAAEAAPPPSAPWASTSAPAKPLTRRSGPRPWQP